MLWEHASKTLLSDSHRDIFFQHAKGLTNEEMEAQFELVSGLVNWVEAKRSASKMMTLGISGAQGTGKSTLAQQLAMMLEENKVTTEILCLDDFYLSKRQREKLAAEVHPLLKTRGVPGTHDIKLLIDAIQALQQRRAVQIPCFDKALDDRMAQSRTTKSSVDVLIVEGWCLGARSQSDEDLQPAINTLEKEEDPRCLWRNYVNQQLSGADWRQLRSCLEFLLYLQVPSFEMVLDWRWRQELQLQAQLRAELQAQSRVQLRAQLGAKSGDGKPSNGKPMSHDQLQNFIMHYERISRQMLSLLPSEADLVFVQNEAHQVNKVLLL